MSNGTALHRLDEAALEHRYVDTDSGVRLHVVDAGKGPLVVLLHGFPEFWYAWRKQIPALVRAGFRVIAPDLRGYNLSDKPRDIAAYGLKVLVEDVAAIIRDAGFEKAHVVGHDWGAGVAWGFAMAHPELLDRLAILNGPHPVRLLRALRTVKQLRKSWYMFMFQIPLLPEMVARRNRYALLLKSLRDAIVPGAFTDEDLDRYAEAYAQPGALTAMIAYYRAMFRPSSRVPLRRIDAQTMVIWGERDQFIGNECAEPRAMDVPSLRMERMPDASHWIAHERPERVNALLVDFFRTPKTAG